MGASDLGAGRNSWSQICFRVSLQVPSTMFYWFSVEAVRRALEPYTHPDRRTRIRQQCLARAAWQWVAMRPLSPHFITFQASNAADDMHSRERDHRDAFSLTTWV